MYAAALAARAPLAPRRDAMDASAPPPDAALAAEPLAEDRRAS
jgi:hypothetical protein